MRTTWWVYGVGPVKVVFRHTGGTGAPVTTSELQSTTPQPPLGPSGAPASQRDHFATPLDLMDYGFNPILSAYPSTGEHWSSSRASSEFATYGVTGSSTVVGMQKVTVPAGTFDALVVRSTLSQPGYPYGSGTRTSWFAPGRGLVKLVFDHGDHSVSTVVLLH